jgi:predicted peptidase
MRYIRIILLLNLSLLFIISSSCQEDHVKDVVSYDYLSYLPSEYQNNENKKWPLVIFLHGASLRGNNLEKIKKYGIPKLINQGRKFDFIIISPQCPLYKDWSSDIWFPNTFDDIKNKFNIDTNRVYLTGLSMGGEGTWYISEEYSKIFAAIAPVCGRISHISSIKKNADKITKLPIWIFHGVKDRVYSVEESDEMYHLLKDLNPEIKYTRYLNLGHGATHDSTFRTTELYEWFLSNKRKRSHGGFQYY